MIRRMGEGFDDDAPHLGKSKKRIGQNERVSVCACVRACVNMLAYVCVLACVSVWLCNATSEHGSEPGHSLQESDGTVDTATRKPSEKDLYSHPPLSHRI